MIIGKEKLNVKVPASTANLGSGFDSIGVAFQLYTELDISLADKLQFFWRDKEGAIGPFPFADKENLILKAMQRVCQVLNKELPSVSIVVQSDIPATRGLGSSASAYVAGLVAMNEWFGGALHKDELLWLAADQEGHPDNVGASLFGGVFMGAIDREQRKVVYNTHPFPEKWAWVVAIPSYTLSTAVARDLLPEEYVKQDVIFNLSRYGLLASSILLGHEEGVKAGLADRLHHPYRKHLIPGFEKLVESKEQVEALGFVISGAGPTVLGLFSQQADMIRACQRMEQWLKKDTHTVQVFPLAVDQTGAQVL